MYGVNITLAMQLSAVKAQRKKQAVVLSGMKVKLTLLFATVRKYRSYLPLVIGLFFMMIFMKLKELTT